MAERPRGFGLSAELQDKKEAKYDHDMALEAGDWIEAVLDEKNIFSGDFGMENMAEVLKDGSVLCRLISTITGNQLKINSSKLAFKQMENIGNFLDACDEYGVSKTDLFQTVDLYEKQNMAQVVNGIHALGRKAQSKGYGGPSLGPRESTEHKREFTEEQLAAGKGVIGLQMGSNKGASQAGSTPYGLGRQVDQPI